MRKKKHTLTSFLSVLIVGVFILSPSVLAGDNGEVIIDGNTISMDLDQEIREIISEILWFDNETNFQFWETDDETGVSVTIKNKNKYELELIGTKNKSKGFPVYLCSQNPIEKHQDELQNSSFCEAYPFQYQLKDMKFKDKQNFETSPLINGTNAFSIWVGDGAGGGGGLPVCSGLATIVSQNQTHTPYQQKFKMGGLGTYLSYAAGCTATSLTWEVYDTETAYIMIPQGVSGNTMLSGNGTIMGKNPVNFNVWYFKYPQCEQPYGDTQNIRMKFEGTYLGKRTIVSSTPLSHTCYAGFTTFNWENPTPPNELIVDSHNMTMNTSITFYKNTTMIYDFNDSLMFYTPFENYTVSNISEVKTGYDISYKGGLSNSDIIGTFLGKGINLTDDNDFLIVENSENSNIGIGNFTFMAWVYPRGLNPSITTDDYILSKYEDTNNRYYLRFRQADYFQFYGKIGGVAHNYQVSSLSPYLQANEWNHLAILFNRTQDKFNIYINGQFSGSTGTASGTGIDYSNNKNWIIGGFSSNYVSGSGAFNGTIDEVSFSNRLLTSNEINMAYLGEYAVNKELELTNLSYGIYNYSAYHNNYFGRWEKEERKITLEAPSISSDTIVWFMFGGLMILFGELFWSGRKKKNERAGR